MAMRFVLVHGGFHGGWCWDKMTPELARLGHEAVCPDLPGHGQRAAERGTLSGYRDAVVDVLEDGDILVGHSMGGYITTMAADVAPVELGHVIYLAACYPLPGKSMLEAAPYASQDLTAHYTAVDAPSGPGIAIESLEDATRFFYHDCTPEDAAWAFDQLTPEPTLPLAEPISLTFAANVAVPRSYIVCTDDQSGHGPFVELFLQRLELAVAYPLWASHSPFLGRPGDTAALLHRIVS
jgi:pimeloyl-ACP methyl ester carboxylesterase